MSVPDTAAALRSHADRKHAFRLVSAAIPISRKGNIYIKKSQNILGTVELLVQCFWSVLMDVSRESWY